MRVRIVLLGFLVAFALGCEKPIPQKPTVVLNPEKVDFGQRYIGTEPQGSIAVVNEGIEDLAISGVETGGDLRTGTTSAPGFTMTGQPDSTVKGRGTTYVQIIFKPTQARTYTGTLTIRSNAANGEQKVVEVTGVGVAAP